MQRRHFLQMTAGAIAAGALGAPAFAARGNDAPYTTASFAAARRFAKLAQGRIAYVDRGRGDVVLFLHGFPLNGYQWRGAIERLAGERRCLAPDFLGLGYTDVAPGQSVAPDAQVEMIVALLDHLGVRQVDLVANDSGGAVAQLVVARHPARVRTLLLTTCDTEIDSPPPLVLPVIEAARKGTFATDTFEPQIRDKHFARTDPTGIGPFCYTYPDKLADDTIDYYFKPLVATPERTRLTNAYAIGLDPNPLAGVEATLKKRTLPVRIVWGTGDTIFKQEAADYLARTFPNVRGVRRLDGAKLFFPEEFPDVIVEELRALWRG
ncbi:MAG TPA: alpha/beta hydrolase [Tahibacter sp.]|nr:alpha/beta hydrolase [Tahibacter sp.]